MEEQLLLFTAEIWTDYLSAELPLLSYVREKAAFHLGCCCLFFFTWEDVVVARPPIQLPPTCQGGWAANVLQGGKQTWSDENTSGQQQLITFFRGYQRNWGWTLNELQTVLLGKKTKNKKINKNTCFQQENSEEIFRNNVHNLYQSGREKNQRMNTWTNSYSA